MKVVFEDRELKTENLTEIDFGNTFILADEIEFQDFNTCNVYILMEPSYSLDANNLYAINLESGGLCRFDEFTKVIKVNAKIIVPAP